LFLTFSLLTFWLAGFFGTSPRLGFGQKVGVVSIEGPILSSENLLSQIVDFREDASIRAIVVRIDSPGGAVGPSQEIHDELKKAAAVKPVVVSMASVAASGGYYAAVPAHSIYANPGTLTGSIGVIMEFTNVEELLTKIGLRNMVIKSGSHKDLGSSVRPMSEEERQILQSLIDDVHGQFVDAVVAGRGLAPELVEGLADGRIYTGRQAKELGLVDELGNFYDAVQKAASLAGLKEKPQMVYPDEGRPSLMSYLVQEVASGVREGIGSRTGASLQFLWSGY